MKEIAVDISNLPATRKEAKEIGAKYYFTGKSCKQGHIAPRKTKGVCVGCMKDDWKKQTLRRKGKPTSEAGKAAQRRYYERNKELVKARAKLQPIEKRREYRRTYKSRNKEAHKAFRNAWRRRQKDATPPWLSRGHRDSINELYLAAQGITRNTGELYVVDHVVPLHGTCICGLHVPWNLRIISNEKNARKNNSFEA